MSKSSIRREIRRKNQEIQICRRLMERVRRQVSRLHQQQDTWMDQRTRLSDQEITAVVVVKRQFEGVQAERMQQALLDSVQWKIQREQQVEDSKQEAECLIQGDEEKVERIAAYLKEYGEDQEMLYIEVIRQKEIAAWLNKNGAVGEQAAAELGRMQIEWDIEQRVQYLKTLTFDELLATHVVIDGKTYSPIRPYHGEIPASSAGKVCWECKSE